MITAITILAILGVAALVVDVGFGMWVRSDLQNISDAGALSGTQALIKIHDRHDHRRYDTHALTDAEKAEVTAAVNKVSLQSKAGGVPIAILPSDIQFGRLDPATREFEETDSGATAVRVLARRDDRTNKPVSTLVRAVTNEAPVRASAAAAVSPPSRVPPGSLHFPIAISQSWFDKHAHHCDVGNRLKLFPPETLQGCAGLHVYDSLPQTVGRTISLIDDTIDDAGSVDLTDPKHDLFGPSPAVIVGETKFFFVGLVSAPVLLRVKALFDTLKDPDGRWKVVVPVFEDKPLDCIVPPIGERRIVGIATAWVTGLFHEGSPLHGGLDVDLSADIACDVIYFGEGGGPDYGTLVGRPSFVE